MCVSGECTVTLCDDKPIRGLVFVIFQHGSRGTLDLVNAKSWRCYDESLQRLVDELCPAAREAFFGDGKRRCVSSKFTIILCDDKSIDGLVSVFVEYGIHGSMNHVKAETWRFYVESLQRLIDEYRPMA